MYLKHVPTGVEVKCQSSRSQGLNRYSARVVLFEKVDSIIRGEESEERQRAEKIRRQKRRRSRRAKEKMLADKHMTGMKKKLRGRILSNET